jgi:anthranilate phosphoribosyltransferase
MNNELEQRIEQAEAFDRAVERTVSKPRILEAPYDLSPEATGNQISPQWDETIGSGVESEEITREVVDQTIENLKQLNVFTSAVAAIVNLQRDVDRLNDNIARAFKEIGHGDTWTKISQA